LDNKIIEERPGKTKKPVSFTYSLVFADFNYSFLKESARYFTHT